MKMFSIRYALVVSLIASFGATAAKAEVPSAPASYSFDEGTGAVAVDESGSGNDGTINGAEYNAGGKNGSALDFGGIDEFDNVDLNKLDVPGDKLTLMAWVNGRAFEGGGSGDPRVISKAVGINEVDHYWMLGTIERSGQIRVRFRLKTGATATDPTATLYHSSGGYLTLNTWHHIAATYDGAFMKIYLDGAEVGSLAKTGNIVQDSTVDAYIGDNPGGSRQFDGLIDDVRILNVALDLAGIQEAMNTPVAPLVVPAGVDGKHWSNY